METKPSRDRTKRADCGRAKQKSATKIAPGVSGAKQNESATDQPPRSEYANTGTDSQLWDKTKMKGSSQFLPKCLDRNETVELGEPQKDRT